MTPQALRFATSGLRLPEALPGSPPVTIALYVALALFLGAAALTFWRPKK